MRRPNQRISVEAADFVAPARRCLKAVWNKRPSVEAAWREPVSDYLAVLMALTPDSQSTCVPSSPAVGQRGTLGVNGYAGFHGVPIDRSPGSA